MWTILLGVGLGVLAKGVEFYFRKRNTIWDLLTPAIGAMLILVGCIGMDVETERKEQYCTCTETVKYCETCGNIITED